MLQPTATVPAITVGEVRPTPCCAPSSYARLSARAKGEHAYRLIEHVEAALGFEQVHVLCLVRG